MANIIRQRISKRLSLLFKGLSNSDIYDPEKLSHFLRFSIHKSESPLVTFGWQLFMEKAGPELKKIEPHIIAANFNQQLDVFKDGVKEAYCTEDNKKYITFTVHQPSVVRNVLQDIASNFENLPKTSNLLSSIPKQKVVVEYSSPNIAKIFHVGHLRSTIIGNFVANLHEYLGHNVIRLNYLGDWGLQFGILSAGFELFGSEEKLKENPLHHLYDVYVAASQKAENEQEFFQKSKDIFHKMEQGDPELLNRWKRFCEISVQEYKKTYSRLGVKFDEYHGESMFVKSVESMLNMLKTKKVAEVREDGSLFMKLKKSENDERQITLQKSDGSSLYLSRDIAAAVERMKNYNFDKMYYVVDNSQSDHFENLKFALEEMGYNWHNKLHHIKYGKIVGMSTRKGDVVFLNDLLREMQNIALERMLATATTRVKENIEETADILGLSGVVVNDFRSRLNVAYKFNWKEALKVKGDSGIPLQYTHARLVSLEEKCGIDLVKDCDLLILKEVETTYLTCLLARFDEVLYLTYQEMEPCHLVHYLLMLNHNVKKALKCLPVRGQEPRPAQARLLLFHCTRLVLGQGMKILGIQPLDKM